MKKWYLRAGLAGLALAVAGGLALAQSDTDENTLHRSFQVSPGGLLTVETPTGSIDVQSGESDRVDVEIRARNRQGDYLQEILDELDIQFLPSGRDVTVRVERKGGGDHWWDFGRRRIRLEFHISVPSAYNVDLKTAGGSIQVDDLEGEVRAVTSGGSLTFGRLRGSVFGRTSGGSISLTGSRGDADVKTSGGSIKIGEVEGNVVAHTSGGSVRVDEVYGSIDASTSGGSVRARISSQPEGDCRLTTSGGSVTVDLAGGIGLVVDAKTSSGRVIADMSVSGSGPRDKHSLRGEINGGGPRLVLRTSGGNIRLRELQ
ncbi:MAG: DUF4097 domain-containing protein [Acidobacteriota bacterium]